MRGATTVVLTLCALACTVVALTHGNEYAWSFGVADDNGGAGAAGSAASDSVPAWYQGHSLPLSESDQSRWDSFRRWAESKRVRWYNLELGRFGGTDRGLRASRRVRQGEVLCAVPRTLLLNSTALLESQPLLRGIVEGIPGDLEASKRPQSSDVLALWLVLETRLRGAQSTYHPYLEMLPSPRDFVDVTSMSEESMKLLEGSSAPQWIRAYQEWNRHTFDLFFRNNAYIKARPKLNIVTFDQWQWAMMVVRSRTFSFRNSDDDDDDAAEEDHQQQPQQEKQQQATAEGGGMGEKGTRGRQSGGTFGSSGRLVNGVVGHDDESLLLVPFADLFNTDPSAPLGIWRVEGDELVFRSPQNYEQGSEVRLNYHVMANMHLMLYYGFVLRNHQQEQVWFQLPPLSDSVPNAPRKRALLRREGRVHGGDNTAQATFLKTGYDGSLVAYMRVVQLDEAELRAYTPYASSRLISLPNELRVLHAIERIAKRMLRGYGATSVEEDEALLDASPAPEWMGAMERMCVVVRMEEKKTLQLTLDRLRRDIRHFRRQVEQETRKQQRNKQGRAKRQVSGNGR